MDGDPRSTDGDNDGVSTVDMGAYESHGYESDCNSNGIYDHLDILNGTSEDCNNSLIPDECELATGSVPDCNSNGLIDSCEIADGLAEDCNGNAVPDECDIDSGQSEDNNGNGIPDECIEVYNVTQDKYYATIQVAIDYAVSGDTIELADGTYTGTGNKNLTYKGKAITVRSASGDPAACIIDCQNSGRGFYFHGGETTDAILEGISITRGRAISSSPGGGKGGGILCTSSSPTIRNCRIVDNEADDAGAGIYCTYGSPIISFCTITQNSYDTESDYVVGGGVYSSRGTPRVSNCQIVANYVAVAGGLYCTGGYVTNCLIADNNASHPESGGDAGGIYCGSTTITNCTIVGNRAFAIYGTSHGGGVYCGSGATISNCIIRDNSPDEVYSGGTPAVTYCNIEDGASEQWFSTGCIDEGPSFIAGSYRLAPDSPCIDSGDNTAVTADHADLDSDGDTSERSPLDLDGNTRFVNDWEISDTGVPDNPSYPAIVDIGAYEFQWTMDDCNTNGIDDDIEIAQGSGTDCNGNALLDECELALDPDSDCNTNGLPDSCDIASGFSQDNNSNGIPDECVTHETQHIFTSSAVIESDDFRYDGHEIIVDGCDLVIKSLHSFSKITLINGANLYAPPAAGGLNLIVDGDLSVDATSSIYVQPDTSTVSEGECHLYATEGTMCQYDFYNGAGGGHGGEGGGETYGSPVGGEAHGDMYTPTTVGGRGGCEGGLGGGTIELEVAGLLHIDGMIAANGADGVYRSQEFPGGEGAPCGGNAWYPGGGAGGSIFLSVDSIDGQGTISANGGDGADNFIGPDGYPGGGGRIAIHYELSMTLPSDHIMAIGIPPAESGTIHIVEAGDCNNNGIDDEVDIAGETSEDCNTNAVPDECDIASGFSLDANTNGIPDECLQDGPVVISTDTWIHPDTATYDNQDIVIDGCRVQIGGHHPFNSVQVINDGTLTGPTRYYYAEGPYGLDIGIANDFTVDATSRVDVSGGGYDYGGMDCYWREYSEWHNSEQYWYFVGRGASHGGRGEGQAEDSTYGSPMEPTTIGQCGECEEGGHGGGRIAMEVGGIATIDGSISANGNDGQVSVSTYVTFGGGGGAGGSIYIVAGSITGSGSISADGGHGGDAIYRTGGKGGGGRIAIYYTNESTFPRANISADGYNPGSVHMAPPGDCNANGLIDTVEMPTRSTLLVSNRTADSVSEIYTPDARNLGDFIAAQTGGLDSPNGIAVDSHGDVYVSSVETDSVIKFSGKSGLPLMDFTGCDLDGPVGIALQEPLTMFVSSYYTDSVVAFDLRTGNCIGEVISDGAGGLLDGPCGLSLADNGDLIVASESTDTVLRCDPLTDSCVVIAENSGACPLNTPAGVTLDDEDNLYVASLSTDEVLNYSSDGTCLGSFASGNGLNGPQGLAWHPDGNLYVASHFTDSVFEFDGTTGQFVAEHVTDGSLNRPTYIAFADLTTDCNANDIIDSCELAAGVQDDDGNGVIDTCDPDFDGDGTIDGLDDDIDDDDVPNEGDVCDYSPLGSPVQSDGGLRADIDGDCHVDLLDLNQLVAATTGPDPQANPIRLTLNYTATATLGSEGSTTATNFPAVFDFPGEQEHQCGCNIDGPGIISVSMDAISDLTLQSTIEMNVRPDSMPYTEMSVCLGCEDYHTDTGYGLVTGDIEIASSLDYPPGTAMEIQLAGDVNQYYGNINTDYYSRLKRDDNTIAEVSKLFPEPSTAHVYAGETLTFNIHAVSEDRTEFPPASRYHVAYEFSYTLLPADSGGDFCESPIPGDIDDDCDVDLADFAILQEEFTGPRTN